MNKEIGFSLIELMVAVAIVAVLVMAALPDFTAQSEKTRRSVAKADLMELSSFMQRFYTQNNRFDQDTGGASVALPFSESPKDGTAKYYDLSLKAVAQSSYELQAKPKGSQAGDPCGNLTIKHTGAKAAAKSDCW